ncbi:MAG: hypothetical protein KF718_13720 [Polyangiaceae bacterium]|nr:hypothetical protein [Polyangiaceae bacterium]
MSDERERDRQAILARRRYFVASALASIAAAGCDKAPQPCLEPPLIASGTTSAEPPHSPFTPCLEPPSIEQPPATADAAAASADAGRPKAIVPPPAPTRPMVCLRPPPVKKQDL